MQTQQQIEPQQIKPQQIEHRQAEQQKPAQSPDTITAVNRIMPTQQRDKPVPSDHDLFRQHLAASKRGDADARFMLGLFYLEGRGVKQSTASATSQFKLAAKQGQGQAQLVLGLMYYTGHGDMIKNVKRAIFWLSKAANQGVADAQYSLGLIYANGADGKKNEAEAIQWWRKAAAQNHAKAQHNLAVSYLNGLGVKANREQAIRHFIEEAEQGDPQAQFNLGRLYSEGKWFDQKGNDAANWFYRAGETWLNLNQPDKARQSIQKIRQLVSKQHLATPNIFLADVLRKKIAEAAIH